MSRRTWFEIISEMRLVDDFIALTSIRNLDEEQRARLEARRDRLRQEAAAW